VAATSREQAAVLKLANLGVTRKAPDDDFDLARIGVVILDDLDQAIPRLASVSIVDQDGEPSERLDVSVRESHGHWRGPKRVPILLRDLTDLPLSSRSRDIASAALGRKLLPI
jgi:hypothetical protein